jgi:protein phosphatase 1G
MGALGAKPVTTKETDNGVIFGCPYAAAAMQGWRRGMEDAHVATCVSFADRKVALFGVFDGHGGKAVARYAAKYLGETFCANPRENGASVMETVKTSLKSSFEALDERLNAPEGREEVRILESQAEAPKPTTDAGDETKGHRGARLSTVGGQIASELGPNADKEDVAGALEQDDADASSSGQRLLQQIMDQHASPEGMGATAVVCALVPKSPGEESVVSPAGWTLVCANAGDSRAVLCRAGKAVALSEDHKPDDPVENKRIYAATGFVRNGRVCDNLNLSRALGDFNYKDFSKPAAERIITCVPDITETPLQQDDEFLLLGCDGIWEKYDRQEVVTYIRRKLGIGEAGGDPVGLTEAACEYLDFAMCKDLNAPDFDGSGCDNMTLMVYRFGKQ